MPSQYRTSYSSAVPDIPPYSTSPRTTIQHPSTEYRIPPSSVPHGPRYHTLSQYHHRTVPRNAYRHMRPRYRTSHSARVGR
eukprot:1808013-Rhodomonas_salina.1